MTDPTPEQIAAAKRWTFLPPDSSTISDADAAILGDAASKDAGYAFCDNEKLFDGALRILAAALASAERDAERFRSHIRRITERHCDCGGAPAGDSGCVACRIYHELNAAVGKEAE